MYGHLLALRYVLISSSSSAPFPNSLKQVAKKQENKDRKQERIVYFSIFGVNKLPDVLHLAIISTQSPEKLKFKEC